MPRLDGDGEGEGGRSSSGNSSSPLDFGPTLAGAGEGVNKDVNLAECGEVAEVLRGVNGASFCVEPERIGEVWKA